MGRNDQSTSMSIAGASSGYPIISTYQNYNSYYGVTTTNNKGLTFYDGSGSTVLSAYVDWQANTRSFWFGPAGYTVINSQYQDSPLRNYTAFFDANGAERMRIIGHAVGPAEIDFKGTKLENAAPGVYGDDVVTMRNLHTDFAGHVGELYPAEVIASRAAMLADIGQVVINEGFESGDLGDITPVIVQNSIEGSIGAGWTISNVRAQSGTYSIQATGNFNKHSTRAVIVFDLALSTVPHNIQFDWYVSSESCCDGLQVAVRETVSGTVLAEWPAGGWSVLASPQNAWNHFSQPRPASHVALQLLIGYRKDGSVNSGSDSLWIDNLQFQTLATHAEPKAYVFEESGTYYHVYFLHDEMFETALAVGQSFRETTGLTLRMYNGTTLVTPP
jgi:hypothetical protein